MRSFKDRAGREWKVDITVLTVERVKTACNVDMPGLVLERMGGLDALLADHLKVSEVIFECGRPFAGDATLEDLRAQWDGSTADAAIEAWLEELIGFFPDARKRGALRKALTGLREMGTQVMEMGAAELAPENIKTEAAKLYQRLRQMSSASESYEPVGKMPDSSAWTPDPSPSGSST